MRYPDRRDPRFDSNQDAEWLPLAAIVFAVFLVLLILGAALTGRDARSVTMPGAPQSQQAPQSK